MTPSYLNLHRSGELARILECACRLQSPCRLCPRKCGAMRADGEKGFCESGVAAKVFRFGPHFGEEPPLTGVGGSGAIFFSGCTLRCTYCQNYRFSQEGEGVEVPSEELAAMFIRLQERKCHNVNWVTPSHFLPQILSALILAADGGFNLPIVYNTSGYESLETLRLLDGCVDIYCADMRYDSAPIAARCSGVSDYPAVNRAAIRAMWEQVGALETDDGGVARKGLIVRHLVLPHGISGTRAICRFIAGEISPGAAVSLMSQYTPCHRASGDKMLRRRVTEDEFREAIDALAVYGLENGWIQDRAHTERDDRFLGAAMESNV